MPHRTVVLMATVVLAVLLPRTAAVGQPLDSTAGKAKVVRIGAVAYAPSAVTIFNDVKRYLNRHGLPADYVLYSSYDALVEALRRGEVDIAWNTPLAHAQYHLRCGASQTLVMRDVDKGVRAVLVARADAGMKSLDDLKGKTLALGSAHSAEARVLPVYQLRKAGVAFNDIKVLDLDKVRDYRGNPCSSPQHVLQAVQEGRADAGIITERLWQRAQAGKDGAALQAVWTSPEFNHCVFTAAQDFDQNLGRRFTELMLQMDPADPQTAECMRLEGTRRWIRGDQEGFADLVEALKQKR